MMTTVDKESLKTSFGTLIEALTETLDREVWDFFGVLTEDEEDNIDPTVMNKLCKDIKIPMIHKNGIGFLGDIKNKETL